MFHFFNVSMAPMSWDSPRGWYGAWNPPPGAHAARTAAARAKRRRRAGRR